jgi:hypothetical protein
MRLGLVLLILLCCADCARLQKPTGDASSPQQAATLEKPAPVAATPPPGFNCSDGTVSSSQDACLIDMARARLPPQQPIAPTPATPSTGDTPTGSVR